MFETFILDLGFTNTIRIRFVTENSNAKIHIVTEFSKPIPSLKYIFPLDS